MRFWTTVAAVACVLGAPLAVRADHVVKLVGHEPGVTPFISLVSATMDNPAALDSYQFTVLPKDGSSTRPVSARYSSAALKARGFLNLDSHLLTLPVYGLYENRLNVVTLTFRFTDGRSQMVTRKIHAKPFEDPHKTFTVVQPRTPDSPLSYDFIMLKTYDTTASPLIIDTDGELRWVGTSGFGSQAAAFYKNGVYLGANATLFRMELDGAVTLSRDMTPAGITGFHHNIDVGRDGLILDVTTPKTLESTNVEVDAAGNVLHKWDLGVILSATMIAGGDDPTGFVQDENLSDWFHNNCTAYRASDNTLLVSSRENFVIALDYDSGAVKWLLGDSSKHWYDYPSLRQYALRLAPGTEPPIGQHSLSLENDHLLLFDDGYQSLIQMPAGISRTYSAPRKYRLNLTRGVAAETWNYPNGESIFSPICSSIYSDQPGNYLIDYSTAGPYLFTEIVGLDATGNKVFDYQYQAPDFCALGWNAAIVHLEDLVF